MLPIFLFFMQRINCKSKCQKVFYKKNKTNRRPRFWQKFISTAISTLSLGQKTKQKKTKHSGNERDNVPFTNESTLWIDSFQFKRWPMTDIPTELSYYYYSYGLQYEQAKGILSCVTVLCTRRNRILDPDWSERWLTSCTGTSYKEMFVSQVWKEFVTWQLCLCVCFFFLRDRKARLNSKWRPASYICAL